MPIKVIDVFARTKADVRYRLKRSSEYKDKVIKKITEVGKDAVGNKKFSVTLHPRKGRKK